MVRRTSIQRTFAETERGYQGFPPERVVYTRNLLRAYIAVVPCISETLFRTDTNVSFRVPLCEGLIQSAASCATFPALSFIHHGQKCIIGKNVQNFFVIRIFVVGHTFAPSHNC